MAETWTPEVIDGGRAGEDRVDDAPPHDLELEASVARNAVLQPDLMPDLVHFVGCDDFYSGSYRQIFASAERLHAAGRLIDIEMVASDLRENRRLYQLGNGGAQTGMAFLTALFDRIPILKRNVFEHARRVRELRVRRDLLNAGRLLATRALGDSVDTATLAAQTGEQIEKLAGALGGIEDEHRASRVAERMMQALENTARKVTTGKSRRWGWDCIDALTAGLHAELAVVGGRPGMGKTSFGCAVAESCARAGFGSPIFSLETQREQLLLRMTCTRARVEMHRARVGALTPEEWTRFTTAAGELAKLPLWIDDTKGIRVAELWARVRRVQLALVREGRELGPVVIDYLQLLGKPRPGMDREEALAENCRALLAMSQELEVPVIALAQLKPEVDKRTDKRPDPGDLRGSGEILMCARTLLLLYRADYYARKKRDYKPTGEIEVNIAKQNNGPTGPVVMRFEEKFGVFAEPIIQDGTAATTYTCGACGERLEAGRSCACGATSTPAAHAAGCRCPQCDPDDGAFAEYTR